MAADQLSPGAEDLADQQAQLFLATGPLADFLDAFGRQLFAVHHAAAGLEGREFLVVVQLA